MRQNGWHVTGEERKRIADWIRTGLACRDGIKETATTYLHYNVHGRDPVTASVLGVALIGKFKGNAHVAHKVFTASNARALGMMPSEILADALNISLMFANQLEEAFIKDRNYLQIAHTLEEAP